jgi:hypothetical protein
MTEYDITPLNTGWWQVEETSPDGYFVAIGCFRTEADAQAWLSIYVRMQQTAARVFRVGWPDDFPVEVAKETMAIGAEASD